MRITAILYIVFVWLFTPHTEARADDARVDAPMAQVDLATPAGLDVVQGAWRYQDVELIPTQFGGAATWDYTPHAGARDFDDSAWQKIEPSTLATRRGHGRISFNWYRLLITVPEQIDGTALAGTTAYFETFSTTMRKCGSMASCRVSLARTAAPSSPDGMRRIGS